MTLGILRGAAAGAAGATALNAATYLDMTVRGRPASTTPSQLAESVAQDAGLDDLLGRGDERENRLEGLGPLLGSGVGVVVGAGVGAVHRFLSRRGRRVPTPVAVVLVAAAAMALSDVPLKVFGLSDPTTWSAKDWTSDIVPHLVYGVVTVATVRAASETAR